MLFVFFICFLLPIGSAQDQEEADSGENAQLIALISRMLNQSLRPLQDHLSSMEGRMASMEGRMASMEGRMASMEGRIDDLFDPVNGWNATLTRRLAELRDDFRADMKSMEEVLTGEGAALLGEATAVQVRSWKDSTYQDYIFGCGTYVLIRNQTYVATVAHVLLGDNGAHLKIDRLILADGTLLKPTGPDPVLYSPEADDDLALIRVVRLADRPVMMVSTEEPTVGQELFGWSHLRTGKVFHRCRVLEKVDMPVNSLAGFRYETDCGGTHGFSGTGYMNFGRYLMALHESEGEFPHAGGNASSTLEGATSRYETAWKKVSTDCESICGAFGGFNKTQYDICMKSGRAAVEVSSRNPRTRMRPACHLLSFAP